MSRFARLLAVLLVSAAASLVCLQQARATTYWENPGAAPYAPSIAKAMAERAKAFRQLGLPEKVVKKLLVATQQPGEHVVIKDGDRFTAMLSAGGVRHEDMVARFAHKKGELPPVEPAVMWVVQMNGRTFYVFLPFICRNWAYMEVTSSASACYRIPLDYRHTPGVKWHDGASGRYATVELHIQMPKSDVRTLAQSPCFGVHSAGHPGLQVPYHECEACQAYGGHWPEATLAEAAGLPPETPNGSFSARLYGGKGYVSLPLGAPLNVRQYLMVICVGTEQYTITLWQGYGDIAITRYDVVTPQEMKRTAHVLDRTLWGRGHYQHRY